MGSASIRGNYEGDGDSDDDNKESSRFNSPGPGQYLTADSSFKSRMRPNSL